MISRDEFWTIMEGYGAGIWPAQVVFYIAAWLLVQSGPAQSLLAKLYLSIAFAWNGIAFYLILAKGMAGDSFGNYVFGGIFIIVSVLFAVDLLRRRMRFSLPPAGRRRYTTLVLSLLVFSYPLFGIASGHELSSLIVPGSHPCPTVAFALLLLTTALPQVDKTIYVLLLLCAIPFTPFVQIARYGVYEDTILVATGIYALILLVRYHLKNPSNQDRKSH
jgi:hypothetical protein